MKKISLYILAIVALVSLAGCNKDFLERAPKLQQTTEIQLATYAGLNTATLGAYYYLGSTTWYTGDRVVENEMRAGNGMKQSYKNSGRCTQGFNWQYTADATNTGMWAYCYYTVAMANNVIDNLEGKADGTTVKEQDLNNLKAECLFLRAFAHFENVLYFGQPYTYVKANEGSLEDAAKLGVPYVFHTDPTAKPARETVLKTYEYIVTDLLEAEKIIDPAYSRAGTADKFATVNIYTIQALLSRVYLYMGEWQKSADYATKVINSGKFKMWTAKEWPDVWGSEVGSGEVIFEVYGKISNGTNGSWDDISYLTKPDGYGDPVATPSLLAMYEPGDVRLTDGFRTDAAGESGYYWTAKYPGKGDRDPNDVNNVIILRLSEMYLNRAEAIMNGASVAGVDGLADLNTIPSNRGASTYNVLNRTNIKAERRKEFAWEGNYINDLARWGDGLTRSNDDFVLGTQNQNVEFPSYKWALPISKRELELNENLVPNPGYANTK